MDQGWVFWESNEAELRLAPEERERDTSRRDDEGGGSGLERPDLVGFGFWVWTGVVEIKTGGGAVFNSKERSCGDTGQATKIGASEGMGTLRLPSSLNLSP